jgi:site-specific DNA recombinase
MWRMRGVLRQESMARRKQIYNNVWFCNSKFVKKKYCTTPTLKEDAIKRAFIEAFNSLIENKEEIFANYGMVLDVITDDSAYLKEMGEIDKKCLDVQSLIAANARSIADQEDYQKRYNEYVGQYDNLMSRRYELSNAIEKCAAKRIQINGFLAELKKQNTLITEFDDVVWQTTLNVMKVFSDGKVVFVFRDGTELPWTIDCEVKSYGRNKDNISLSL